MLPSATGWRRARKSDDCLNPDLTAVEGACVARPLAFNCDIERGRRRDAHQFIPVAGEAVGRDSDDELASGNLDDRPFLDARLGSEIDRLKPGDLVGMSMDRLIESLGEVAREQGLRELVIFDRLA